MIWYKLLLCVLYIIQLSEKLITKIIAFVEAGMGVDIGHIYGMAIYMVWGPKGAHENFLRSRGLFPFLYYYFYIINFFFFFGFSSIIFFLYSAFFFSCRDIKLILNFKLWAKKNHNKNILQVSIPWTFLSYAVVVIFKVSLVHLIGNHIAPWFGLAARHLKRPNKSKSD